VPSFTDFAVDLLDDRYAYVWIGQGGDENILSVGIVNPTAEDREALQEASPPEYRVAIVPARYSALELEGWTVKVGELAAGSEVLVSC
jgi:hypothetical protein